MEETIGDSRHEKKAMRFMSKGRVGGGHGWIDKKKQGGESI